MTENNIMTIPLTTYHDLYHKADTFNEVFDLLREYQYQERTNPGPDYEHVNRCKALVHDLEWIFRKYCGPTVEECPYAE